VRGLVPPGSTPDQLTPGKIVTYCAADGRLANNSVRCRVTAILSFLAYAADEGHPIPNVKPVRRLLKSYPRTYGKSQGRRPGRWLTYDEAFGKLVAACRDDSIVGLRDEIVIRLGLSGLRASEIRNLRWHDVQTKGARPQITFTGKGNRPANVTLSPTLVGLLRELQRARRSSTGTWPTTDTPVIPNRNQHRGTDNPIRWDAPLNRNTSVYDIVTRRAAAAGLGHVAPHDLRRSAAGILHRSVDTSGAHHYDLLDIQRVLRHANPAITMRSYLEPIDTDVLDRAARTLD
jgi:integrase